MNGWIVGYVIGAVVVAVLVTVLMLMIVGARRTAEKAETIADALRDARDGTAALWQVQATVASTDRIVRAAGSARSALTPGGGA